MSQQDVKDTTRRFNIDLKGAYSNGNGGGHIQVAKWTEGFVIELESGQRAGVVTDRESITALRDNLTALLDATAEDEGNG